MRLRVVVALATAALGLSVLTAAPAAAVVPWQPVYKQWKTVSNKADRVAVARLADKVLGTPAPANCYDIASNRSVTRYVRATFKPWKPGSKCFGPDVDVAILFEKSRGKWYQVTSFDLVYGTCKTRPVQNVPFTVLYDLGCYGTYGYATKALAEQMYGEKAACYAVSRLVHTPDWYVATAIAGDGCSPNEDRLTLWNVTQGQPQVMRSLTPADWFTNCEAGMSFLPGDVRQGLWAAYSDLYTSKCYGT